MKPFSRYIFPSVINIAIDSYSNNISLPDNWVASVIKSILYRNSKDQWEKDFKFRFSNSNWDKNTEMCRGLYLFNDTDAKEICRRYLDLRERNEWPLLMGTHPVMDHVLGQRFKSHSQQPTTKVEGL